MGARIDGSTHRLAVVADHEQRAAGSDGVQKLATARSSGVRGIDAYWADTRSNAAASNPLSRPRPRDGTRRVHRGAPGRGRCGVAAVDGFAWMWWVAALATVAGLGILLQRATGWVRARSVRGTSLIGPGRGERGVRDRRQGPAPNLLTQRQAGFSAGRCPRRRVNAHQASVTSPGQSPPAIA